MALKHKILEPVLLGYQFKSLPSKIPISTVLTSYICLTEWDDVNLQHQVFYNTYKFNRNTKEIVLPYIAGNVVNKQKWT